MCTAERSHRDARAALRPRHRRCVLQRPVATNEPNQQPNQTTKQLNTQPTNHTNNQPTNEPTNRTNERTNERTRTNDQPTSQTAWNRTNRLTTPHVRQMAGESGCAAIAALAMLKADERAGDAFSERERWCDKPLLPSLKWGPCRRCAVRQANARTDPLRVSARP